MKVFGRFDADLIESRRLAALELLQFVASQPHLYESEALATFLQGSEIIVRQDDVKLIVDVPLILPPPPLIPTPDYEEEEEEERDVFHRSIPPRSDTMIIRDQCIVGSSSASETPPHPDSSSVRLEGAYERVKTKVTRREYVIAEANGDQQQQQHRNSSSALSSSQFAADPPTLAIPLSNAISCQTTSAVSLIDNDAAATMLITSTCTSTMLITSTTTSSLAKSVSQDSFPNGFASLIAPQSVAVRNSLSLPRLASPSRVAVDDEATMFSDPLGGTWQHLREGSLEVGLSEFVCVHKLCLAV